MESMEVDKSEASTSNSIAETPVSDPLEGPSGTNDGLNSVILQTTTVKNNFNSPWFVNLTTIVC